jgi:hypothetical protein
MVERHNGEHSPITSGDRGTCAINMRRFKSYKARTNLAIGGEKNTKTLTLPNSFVTGVQKYSQVVSMRGSLQLGLDQ